MYLIIIVIKYIVHPTSKQIFIINHLSAFLETHVLFLIKCVKGILLGGANYLAVSSLDEALKVRKITDTRILVLEPIDTKYINIANKNNITLTISSLEYLNKVKNKIFTCHLKINTGMNRLGIGTKEELNEIYKIINESNIKIEGIYTHIYKSTDSTLTESQFKRFENITSDINLSKIEIVHIPNSDTITNYKKKDYSPKFKKPNKLLIFLKL